VVTVSAGQRDREGGVRSLRDEDGKLPGGLAATLEVVGSGPVSSSRHPGEAVLWTAVCSVRPSTVMRKLNGPRSGGPGTGPLLPGQYGAPQSMRKFAVPCGGRPTLAATLAPNWP
jgi:hypothetical protein